MVDLKNFQSPFSEWGLFNYVKKQGSPEDLNSVIRTLDDKVFNMGQNEMTFGYVMCFNAHNISKETRVKLLSMEREDRRKVTKNLVTIEKTLKKDLDGITDRLVEEGIFSEHSQTEISNTPAKMKCGVFINFLLRGGPRAYRCFKDILEECGYHKLVNCLERPPRTVCPDVEHEWNNDREKTFIVPSPQITLSFNAQREEDEIDISEPEVVKIKRMMTFVLNTMNDKVNRNSIDNSFEKTFESENKAESIDNDELLNLFRTLPSLKQS